MKPKPMQGLCIATDADATAHIIFNLDYKPPSLNAEDKMSITPNDNMSAKAGFIEGCLCNASKSTAKLEI